MIHVYYSIISFLELVSLAMLETTDVNVVLSYISVSPEMSAESKTSNNLTPQMINYFSGIIPDRN